jgi:hypothetical protein
MRVAGFVGRDVRPDASDDIGARGCTRCVPTHTKIVCRKSICEQSLPPRESRDRSPRSAHPEPTRSRCLPNSQNYGVPASRGSKKQNAEHRAQPNVRNHQPTCDRNSGEDSTCGQAAGERFANVRRRTEQVSTSV